MQKVALVVVALVLMTIITMPNAHAQSDGVTVKNALVVLTGQNDSVIGPAIATGGSPSSIKKTLELTKELLSVTAPYTSTQKDGHFELDVPSNSGAYNVTVFAPSFVASDATSISTSSNTSDLTIFMQPSAMISGRVVDDHGEPISGIVVAAESPHSANYDITMDDGIFVLDTGLKTGLHKIYAFEPGIDTAKIQNLLNDTEIDVPVQSKFPSFFKKQNEGYLMYSSVVEVKQGKLTTLNIQLKRSQTIFGKVVDGNGNPVPDAAVFAFNSNGTMANALAITERDGKYILNNDLPSGTYTVIVPALFSKGYTSASATIQLPSTDSVNFTLHKSSTISGKVVDGKGKAVRNATVFAISETLNSKDTELAQFLAASAATAKTDQQGLFTLNSGIGEGAYVVTAAFGSVPLSNSIAVQAGDNAANITLNFAETIVASGKVVDSNDGKPIKNALVVPSFANAISGTEIFASKTNSEGAFYVIVPLRDNNTKSLFSEISVSADGYNTTTVEAKTDTVVKMERLPFAKLTGQVVAQKSLSPPIETVLTRKGTIILNHDGTNYSVGLQTNSRMLDANFDPQNKRFTMQFEGAQGGAGRSEFIIPKEFLASPFVVSLDGKEVQQDDDNNSSVKVSENQTHATIEVEHEHGLQEITIQGTTAVPEFPFPAVIVAAGLSASLAYRRLHR